MIKRGIICQKRKSKIAKKIIIRLNENQFNCEVKSNASLISLTFVDYIKGSLLGFIFRKKREMYNLFLRHINKGLSFENLIRINMQSNNNDDSYVYKKIDNT